MTARQRSVRSLLHCFTGAGGDLVVPGARVVVPGAPTVVAPYVRGTTVSGDIVVSTASVVGLLVNTLRGSDSGVVFGALYPVVVVSDACVVVLSCTPYPGTPVVVVSGTPYPGSLVVVVSGTP